ncbi:Nucleotidyltransferase [Rickenella mellea]|uniref:DNA polymerase n=1 Tax=Rickenella mellea TaxID=50990 RepID=A0A4Y7Q4T0_9AGAM|nr:Nucleotidyltransferase [Rickenella mellea]
MLKLLAGYSRATLHPNIHSQSPRATIDICRKEWCYYTTKTPYADPNGPNYAIIKHLTRSLEKEDQSAERNEFKVRAFAGAIKALGQVQEPIRSPEDAKKLYGIGEGIARRIGEYLAGSVPKTPSKSATSVSRDAALAELQTVIGIGPHKAGRLFDDGCKSIEDLRTPAYRYKMTPAVQTALEFVHVVQPRVTREEAERVKSLIKDLIPSEYEIQIIGSYRRAQPTSSDIDIALISPSFDDIPTPTVSVSYSTSGKTSGRPKKLFPDVRSYTNIEQRRNSTLQRDVVTVLEKQGLIAGTFMSGPRKWQGIVRVPGTPPGREDSPANLTENILERLQCILEKKGTFVRMDITLIPHRCSGAALLAMTGDLEFNRHIRTLASKQGLHLNEFGLWRWRPKSADSKRLPDVSEEDTVEGNWEFIVGETEEEVLRELGMNYIEPEKRNFAFIVKSGKQKQLSESKRGRPKTVKSWEQSE